MKLGTEQFSVSDSEWENTVRIVGLAIVFWNITPCNPQNDHQRFEGTCCLNFKSRIDLYKRLADTTFLLFSAKDGSNTSLQKSVDIHQTT
jgi:hypothetical protein